MSDTVASRQVVICRIVYSFIGTITGISVFFVWLFIIKPRTDATIHIISAGGLSGVLAAWNMVTHIMHLRGYWRSWLKGLRFFMVVGVSFAVLAAVGCMTYIVLGATRQQEMLISSFYIASVWCFIAMKWGAMLAWHSRSYRNEFSDLSVLLDF